MKLGEADWSEMQSTSEILQVWPVDCWEVGLSDLLGDPQGKFIFTTGPKQYLPFALMAQKQWWVSETVDMRA